MTGNETTKSPIEPPSGNGSIAELTKGGVVMSSIRYRIIAVSVFMAFSLYLDRVCLSEIVKSNSFNNDVKLSKEQIGSILGSFFFTYALFQVPAGWVSDRFGARKMLTGYILAWSVLTALTGFMTTGSGLLLTRLGCGIAQAGAYPTSNAVLRRWTRLEQRGLANSLISFGGRLGGTLAPILTTMLILYIGGWRETLWLYGVIGILIAIGYWWTVRDRPAEHPSCDAAEQEYIGPHTDDRRPVVKDVLIMLRACCTSRSLCLSSLSQFSINIGWAFLITWLPTYLKESKDLDDKRGALMVTIILATGMLGQLIGGWAADRSVRRFGLRIGRVLPISIACTIAGISYLCCPFIDSVWGVVTCLAIVSLMTDIGNPSVWGFMQDVGGRNTGAIFGWANMWGNFGAAVSAIMFPKLLNYGA
ncbi:MAG TPA: MFS transporter, partial [Planctomycetes bacterium]|nr:MFS transporter [Planctomycetota bacterium]